MKQWEQLQLTLDNSKSKQDRTIIRINTKIVQGNETSSYRI